jgi:hypothetical protein
MPFISNIVKIRQVFAQITFVLSLLQDILSFVPVPCLVNFAKILNDQVVNLNPALAITENTKTFRMYSEVRVDLLTEILDCP